MTERKAKTIPVLVGVGVIHYEDLQAQRRLDHELHLRHIGDGLVERRGQAGLGSHDERQLVGCVAAMLQDRIDVDTNLGERTGDARDDAGTILDNKAQLVRGDEITGNRDLLRREPHADAALGDGEHIAHHGNRRRMAACAVAAEHYIAAEATAGDNHVLRAVRPRDRRNFRHQHRRNSR